jgi:hypothetical protein
MNIEEEVSGRNHSSEGLTVFAIHPIAQMMATGVTLYAFYLGVQRFRFLHLHHRAVFRWKRHVAFGEIALFAMLAGMVGGMAVVYLYWRRLLITGDHSTVAVVMVPFIIFGIVSGVYMNRRRENRNTLRVVHGLNNLVVMALALTQVVSGFWFYRALGLGG